MYKTQATIGGISVEIIQKANLKNMYLRIFPPDGTVTVSCSTEFKEEEIRLFNRDRPNGNMYPGSPIICGASHTACK